ncbi:MAG: 2-dehydro-3-deoxygalactonokinase, partial [Balneolaceae bacterium]
KPLCLRRPLRCDFLRKPYLSCDWGTTSFRLKLANLKSDLPKAVISGSRGIKKMHELWNQQKETISREKSYRNYLKEKVSSLQQVTDVNLEGLPIVLSGMASSSIGLKELPYAQLPLDLNQPSLETETLPATAGFPHDVILISGLRSSDDIMRGEETQLLGLVHKHNLEEGLCIFPGTHSKHMTLHNKQLTNFKTYLTGELFELLGNHSILSNSVYAPDEPSVSKAFEEGLQESLDNNLLHSLFQIRAMDLLQKRERTANYEFLSGLLIGTELKNLSNGPEGPIVLTGENQLQAYYSRALAFLQLTHLTHESGEDLTLLGHNVLMRKQNAEE